VPKEHKGFNLLAEQTFDRSFCPFCGKAIDVRSKEHVFSEWAIARYGYRRSPMGTSMSDWRSRKDRKFAIDSLQRTICKSCNTGWMNHELEIPTQRIYDKLEENGGRVDQLGEFERKTLCRWLIKSAYVLTIATDHSKAFLGFDTTSLQRPDPPRQFEVYAGWNPNAIPFDFWRSLVNDVYIRVQGSWLGVVLHMPNRFRIGMQIGPLTAVISCVPPKGLRTLIAADIVERISCQADIPFTINCLALPCCLERCVNPLRVAVRNHRMALSYVDQREFEALQPFSFDCGDAGKELIEPLPDSPVG
jgi:hypothetical protein